MVTKFATVHGVDSAAKDLVTNFMASPSAQTQLAAANGRPPANTKAKSSDPVLAQFSKASQGRRADAEHPADELGLGRSRPGVGSLHEGRRLDGRSEVVQGRGPQHRREDRLVERQRGRPSGRPRSLTAPPALSERHRSDTRRAAAFQARADLTRRSRRSRASPGWSSRWRCSRSRTGSRSGRPYVLADQHHWVALPILVAATLGDRLHLSRAASLDVAAEVPDPGNGLPACVPDRPDHLHDQDRVLELLDGPRDHARPTRSRRSRSTRCSRPRTAVSSRSPRRATAAASSC